MSAYRSFSQEIFDTIIDHLYSHKPTLSLCSIICKSWLPRCRYHLFFEVNLTPKFVGALCSSPHAMNTIVPYIRNAALGGAWSLTQREAYDQVLSLLLHLSSVQSLTIETWSWDFISPTSKALILKAEGNLFQNVTRLRLQYFQFPSFSLLTTSISGFSMLEDLFFDNVTWEVPALTLSSGLVNRNTSPLRFLEKLSIHASLVKPILQWLFGAEPQEMLSTQALHSLVLPELLPSDIPVVGRVLRTLGFFLRHVEIGFYVHNYDNLDMRSLAESINLLHNGALRTLHIHHLTLYQFPPPSSESSIRLSTSPVFWLVPLLSNISSPITELVLHMWMSEEDNLDLIDWSSLRRILSQPPFEALKSLQFNVLGLSEGRDDLEGWLLARLSPWGAHSNVVRVAFI